jgi:hypothetical protein
MRAADIAAFSAHCAQAGLDIVHPFRLDWFNDHVEPSLRLPDADRPRSLGFVIGNTLRLWPVFTGALRASPALAEVEHPLDAYVEGVVLRAVEQSIAARHHIFWAHRMTPAPVAIQRVAHATGLAHLAPSRLSIHSFAGPWLGLRAIIVVDVDGPEGERPVAVDPCTSCTKPCLVAFDEALSRTDVSRPDDVERQWKAWANVREVCPVGKDRRYGDDQLRYHYAKDRSILLRIVRE